MRNIAVSDQPLTPVPLDDDVLLMEILADLGELDPEDEGDDWDWLDELSDDWDEDKDVHR